jgi:hypothetical protein
LRWRVFGFALSTVLAVALGTAAAQAAEYGTGPWVKGYTDIFGGILPPQPGLYVRNDAYHYEGEVGATIFDGNVQLGVEERYLADILALTYVTPWKILGGTYAVAVAPSIVQMNVDVGATISGLTFTGPRDLRTFHIPSLTVSAADHELAQGDTRLRSAGARLERRQLPLELRLVRLCPDRRVQQEQYRQYQPPSLGGHAEARRHLFQSEDRVASERRRRLFGELGKSTTDYETGEI